MGLNAIHYKGKSTFERFLSKVAVIKTNLDSILLIEIEKDSRRKNNK